MNDILCFISGKELAKLALTLAVTIPFTLSLKQKIKRGQSTIKVYVSNQKPLFVFKPITWAGGNGTQWPIKQPNVTLKCFLCQTLKSDFQNGFKVTDKSVVERDLGCFLVVLYRIISS